MTTTSTLNDLAQVEVDFNEVESSGRLFALLGCLNVIPEVGTWVQLYDDNGNMALGEIVEINQARGFLTARVERSTFQATETRFFVEIPDALRPCTPMPLYA